MAPSIRRPLRACLFTSDIIIWICFVCITTCQSKSISPSTVAQHTNDENSAVDVEIRLMPTIVKPTLAITSSNNKKHVTGCHGQDCNSSKTPPISVHTFNHDDQATKEASNSFSTAQTSSKQHDSASPSSEMSGDQRFRPDGQRRLARSALNKNFLRFGRNGLNKNFLRFGRRSLKENFLRFGRSDLPRNFLRFGRNDFLEDLPSDDYQLLHDEEKADFPTTTSSNRKLLEAIQTFDDDNNSDQLGLGEEPCDKSNIVPDANTRACGLEEVDSKSPNSDYENYGETKTKRGSLDKKYLDLRRRYYPKVYGGKRGSLDRNFLRFGKRWSLQADFKKDEDGEDVKGMGEKVKRQIDRSASGSFDDDDSHLQSKKSVLLLANPWINKKEKSQSPVGDQQSTHEEMIRRRSLDKKVWSDLQSNFIRFGRR